MKKILLSGCNGKMGKVISNLVSSLSDCAIAAGVDLNTETNGDFPVYADPFLCETPVDVIIDFSHPSAFSKILSYALEKKTPLVVATTGLSEEQLQLLEKASGEIPVFFSANMSVGVNLLIDLVQKATAALWQNFDIEIVEKHHNQKIDAPSGTALMLAKAAASSLPQEPQYVYDRHSERKKREQNEIGIHSIRGGTIVGEHDVIFAGKDEIVTLSHTALSKEIFASGAVRAAIFLADQKPGFYCMKNLLA